MEPDSEARGVVLIQKPVDAAIEEVLLPGNGEPWMLGGWTR